MFMTNLSRLDVIRLFALGMPLLLFPATSWGQQLPPVAEQMAKTYGLDSFGQIEGIRFTFDAELLVSNFLAPGNGTRRPTRSLTKGKIRKANRSRLPIRARSSSAK